MHNPLNVKMCAFVGANMVYIYIYIYIHTHTHN